MSDNFFELGGISSFEELVSLASESTPASSLPAENAPPLEPVEFNSCTSLSLDDLQRQLGADAGAVPFDDDVLTLVNKFLLEEGVAIPQVPPSLEDQPDFDTLELGDFSDRLEEVEDDDKGSDVLENHSTILEGDLPPPVASLHPELVFNTNLSTLELDTGATGTTSIVENLTTPWEATTGSHEADNFSQHYSSPSSFLPSTVSSPDLQSVTSGSDDSPDRKRKRESPTINDGQFPGISSQVFTQNQYVAPQDTLLAPHTTPANAHFHSIPNAQWTSATALSRPTQIVAYPPPGWTRNVPNVSRSIPRPGFPRSLSVPASTLHTRPTYLPPPPPAFTSAPGTPVRSFSLPTPYPPFAIPSNYGPQYPAYGNAQTPFHPVGGPSHWGYHGSQVSNYMPSGYAQQHLMPYPRQIPGGSTTYAHAPYAHIPTSSPVNPPPQAAVSIESSTQHSTQQPQPTYTPTPPPEEIPRLKFQLYNHGEPHSRSTSPYVKLKKSDFVAFQSVTCEIIKPGESTVCGVNLTSAAEVKNHFTKYHKMDSHECLWKKCSHGRPFTDFFALRSHVVTVHTPYKRAYCPYEGCEEGFQTQRSCNNHMPGCPHRLGSTAVAGPSGTHQSVDTDKDEEEQPRREGVIANKRRRIQKN